MELLKPGIYRGKIVNYGMRSVANGTAVPVITFAITTDVMTELTWLGSFSDKARDITFKALITCGFRHPSPNALAQGPKSGLLDTAKEYSITVEQQTYNGHTTNRVKWINEGIRHQVDQATVEVMNAGLNLHGSFLAMLGQHGIEPNHKPVVAAPPEHSHRNDDDIDIPF